VPCFEPTAAYEEANRDLYLVINAAQAALKLAHDQAEAVALAEPNLTQIQLREGVFPGLASKGVKVDVNESFFDRTVEENWSVLANFALIAVIARYEAWLDATVSLFPKSFQKTAPVGGGVKTDTRKALQFPSSKTANFAGVEDGLRTLTAGRDQLLDVSVRPALHRARGTRREQLQAQLKIYRHFKAIRNAMAHTSGTATPEVREASLLAKRVKVAGVGVHSLPEIRTYKVGDAVSITVRDVVLFDALITRIVRTLDAELSSSHAGRAVIEARARRFAALKQKAFLPYDAGKRARVIKRFMAFSVSVEDRREHLAPTPSELAAFQRFLLSNRIAVQ
jgi:hypothetical protein